MQWEIVVGLEVHTQLSTQSKIFSGSSTAFGAEPNTQASAVDIALPGVLPVLNKGAVERAIQLGLAINANISRRSVFARKNYFYPDLPKGYQISQMELPVVEGGHLTIQVGDVEKVIRITRAHLEEDAGKSIHGDFHGMTGIDLNRAGTPLLEIVSEPDMRGSAEAVAYAKALHSLVVWLGICDGNMQEGSFRCDANVSVRPKGSIELGTRCEIKNLNSFRFMERAIEYEARRQIEINEDGGTIRQETRLYDPDRDETRTMRSKEDAHDYRYFPDPDLLPLVISEEWIARTRAAMPELPAAMRERFVGEYAISAYDAAVLTSTKAMASYFEAAVGAAGGEAKICANWMMGELSAALNRAELTIEQSPVSAAQLAMLVRRISDGTLSGKLAKEVFEALWQAEGGVDEIIEARGLKQVSDSGAIEAVVAQVLADNPNQVAEYRAGKEKMLGYLIGQAMKAMKGKANPQQLNEILLRMLA
ncbi:Asp-tRNA(Asn)/Glu-tRNA(Gln) amidotransferase subunit GatB [Sulfuriferula nivalis]|uniref:Aspartyl/glutamyl-tRNA(Asn/Gln) amidotransferase subunit B n=1 Tax=Sulfuriferula nivalis TaxID=2675298 RepID=A0A809RDW5_9PROT|nr:Asp-tRNA(Asn)/Glu-tRNA(Gln) amidotransferase subunit GatB [Sulfuriferula nivalis]BBO99824.1 aspartyl/glutamyl-tRNA(Asn/Gln) amidotransferase subunit B [Sulfuriferula nivalis]